MVNYRFERMLRRNNPIRAVLLTLLFVCGIDLAVAVPAKNNIGDVDALYAKAKAELGLKKYQAAAADAQKALGIAPPKADYYYVMACILHEKGKLEEAIADFIKAIELDDSKPEYYVQRAMTYIADKQIAKAVKDLDKAIALSPGSFDPYGVRGHLYCQQGKFEEALKDFTWRIERKSLAEDYRARAYVHSKLGRLPQSLNDCRAALKLDPKNVEGLLFCGELYCDDSKYAEAAEDFSKALLYSRNAKQRKHLLEMRAYSYYKQDKLSLALDDLNSFIGSSCANALAYDTRGNIHYKLGHDQAAEKDFKTAIALAPYREANYKNHGKVLYRMGKYELAVAAFSKAISLRSDYAEAYFYRALAEEKLGDKEKSSADRQSAFKLGYHP